MERNSTTPVEVLGVPAEENVEDSVNVSLVAFGNPLGLFFCATISYEWP